MQAVTTLQKAAPPGVPGGAWNGIVVHPSAQKDKKSCASSQGGGLAGAEAQGAQSGGTDRVDAAAATTSTGTSPTQGGSYTAPGEDEGGQTEVDAKREGADDGKNDATEQQQPGASTEAAASDQDTNPPTDAAAIVKSETSSYKGILEKPSS